MEILLFVRLCICCILVLAHWVLKMVASDVSWLGMPQQNGVTMSPETVISSSKQFELAVSTSRINDDGLCADTVEIQMK